MRTTRVPLGRLAAALVLLGFASCNDDDGGTTVVQPGAISGTILFVPAPAAPPPSELLEAEPNDSVDLPQELGRIAPGARLSVRGELAVGETFDAFALVATERCWLRARLSPAPGVTAELALFDPLAMQLAAAPSAQGRAEGLVRGAFDLVVRPEAGAGPYQLVVEALPCEAQPEAGGWLGAFGAGETLELRADARGAFELTAAEALRLEVSARSGPVRVLDTAEQPSVLLGGTDASSALRLDLAPLARVAIECAPGARVVLSTSASGAEPATPRLAALGRERARWGLPAGSALYGHVANALDVGGVLALPRADAALDGELARRGLAVRGRVGEDVLELHAARIAAQGDPEQAARATVALMRSLGASPRVEYAELNRVRTLQGVGDTFTPDDPNFGLQWHYPLVRLPEAWEELRNHALGTELEDVIVAVIDTGRRPHPDLDASTRTDIELDLITDPDSSGDGDGLDADAYDEGDSLGLSPSSFHGTHVAGTIAALTDNALGVAGAASIETGNPTPRSHVQVVHLRAVGKGGATDADVARAIRYAAALSQPGVPLLSAPVDVINMSLGGPGGSATLQNACTAARNRGVTLFAAAGNESTSTPFFPAAASGVVSVSAVDLNSVRAPYANVHPSVDLCAPGGDTSVDLDQDGYPDGVLSTLVDESDGSPVYAYYQGTSMATPHAAAVAALMKCVRRTQLPGEIEGKLANSAVDLGTPGRDSTYGDGLLDALAAVRQAGTGSTGVPLLGVAPGALYFGRDASELRLELFNAGGGSLTVNVPTASQPWLSLGPIAAPPGGSINATAILARVDRASPLLAADGSYDATITLTSTGGGQVVPVNVVVGSPPPTDVALFVLAVQIAADELLTVAQAEVNPTTGLAYALDQMTTATGELLPPGEYWIVCGSDESGDGAICGPGDVYCGLYPTSDSPAVVSVNGDVPGVDFVVAPIDLITITSAPASQTGWRLLRPAR
jgi:subtilisin family serine protease